MKTSEKFFLIAGLFGLLLTSCGVSGNSSGGGNASTQNYFTVTWKNYDGVVLETDVNVPRGTTPTYDGVTPTRPSDAEYKYTWSGWSPRVSPVTANQIYTATYSAEKLKTEYVINFDLGGGTSVSYQGPKTVESFSKDIFFFDCVKEGWNFRGWSYNGTKIFDEKGNQLATPTLAKSMTFVAQYAQTAKLTIVTNIAGAGTISGEGEYPFNTYVDVSAYPKQGYAFDGWYYQNALLSSANVYRYLIWSEDVTLEARFGYGAYVLNIHTNSEDHGLVLLKTSTTTDYLAEYEAFRAYESEVSIAAYSKTDVRFLGWYDERSQLVSANAVYTFKMPSHNYTLEATWNYFPITYNLDGGTNDASNPSYYTVESTFAFADPSKTGYQFAGWYDASGNKVTSISAGTMGALTLTAHWTALKNNLSVTSEDTSKGTVAITSGSGYSGEQITVVATPKGDNAFEGWFHESTQVSASVTYTFAMPANDYSLVARFTTPQDKEEWDLAHGVIPQFSEDGKTVAYGLYPQKNVDDVSLIAALRNLTTPESNGWYLYEGEYYAKVKATPSGSGYLFDNGTTIYEGATYWFKCEPIVWNVLRNVYGECYILSSVLLDAHYYHNTTLTEDYYTGNDYGHSDIRAWLNGEFYNTAFALGDSYIQVTTVDNSAESTAEDINFNWCSDTNDKVFLASRKDYMNSNYGFATTTTSTDTRGCRTTDWARARGAYYSRDDSNQYNGFYWTRSPYSGYTFSSWIVISSGSIAYYDVNRASCCTRPALMIDIGLE